MKNYQKFILENTQNKQSKYINTIISYLNKNTNYTYAEYDEHFSVIKKDDNKKYDSILYLMVNLEDNSETKAIRFNFDGLKLQSIDMWENFEFDLDNGPIYNKPSYEMTVPNSVLEVLDDIVAFVEGEFTLNENINLDDIEKSPEENVKSDINKFDNLDLDLFEIVKANVIQIAFNENARSMIVSGVGGLGKTHDVRATLNQFNKKYQYYKGNTTSAGLYELLFRYRKELIVLDDMDDALIDKSSRDILKAVLDTGEERVVSRKVKGYYYPDDKTDEEIDDIYIKTGKLPNQFSFVGKVIFITNLKEEEIDPVIFTRVVSIDVDLTQKQIIQRIKKIMPSMLPKIPMDMKEETLELMIGLLDTYVEKAPLNLRSFYHCINFRVSNDFDVNGEKLWKILVKNFLVRKTKLSDIVDENENS